MRLSRKILLSSVACLSMAVGASAAFAYDTTNFTVSLNDPANNGTMSLGNGTLGNGTSSLSAGGNVYNYSYQYFTPGVTGTYVFGQLSAPSDTVILLYSPLFNPSSANVNFLDMNDDGDTSGLSGALQTYVDAQIASRSCGGSDGLCPLLSSTLTAGVDYYVVVTTYQPGMSLGSGTLGFFVIGDALVGVGGAPPPGSGYVTTSAPTPVSNLATYLDANDDSGQLATVATYLNSASAAEVTAALKEIFPVNAAVATQTAMNATGQTATVLIDKVGTVLGSISSPSMAFADGTVSSSQWMFGDRNSGDFNWDRTMGFTAASDTSFNSPEGGLAGFSSLPYKKFEENGRAFWIQGVGGITRGDDTSETHAYKARSVGVVSGYEAAIDADNLAGVLLSAFSSKIDVDDNAGETDVQTYSLGLYGQHLFGATKLTGVVLGSYSFYDNERFVSVGGITGNPQADYNGWGTSATLSLSRLYEEGEVKIEPFVSGNFSLGASESYTESGGAPFNMSVDSDTSSTVSTKAGVTFQYEADIDGESSIEFKVKPYAGYQWELNEASNAVRIGGAASSTVVDGRDVNTAQVGLSLESKYEMPSGDSIKLGLDVSHDKNEDTGIAYLGYGVKF